MSGCRIERTLDDVGATLDRAKQEAAKFRSVFRGDTSGGDYSLKTPLGSIDGTYTVEGHTVRFDIAKKPTLVPRVLVERVLDEFLRAGAAAKR